MRRPQSVRRLSIVAVAALLVVAAGGCRRDEARREDPAASTKAPSPQAVTVHPSQGELGTQLAAQVAIARGRNLKPFVELRADWCGPCKELEASMSDPRMADAFAGTYLVRLDVDDWKSAQLSAFGLDGSSIPAFFAVDDKGKALVGRKITGGAWAENVPENMAPPLKAFFSGR